MTSLLADIQAILNGPEVVNREGRAVRLQVLIDSLKNEQLIQRIQALESTLDSLLCWESPDGQESVWERASRIRDPEKWESKSISDLKASLSEPHKAALCDAPYGEIQYKHEESQNPAICLKCDAKNERILELELHILSCQEMADAGVFHGKIVEKLTTIYVGPALVADHIDTAARLSEHIRDDSAPSVLAGSDATFERGAIVSFLRQRAVDQHFNIARRALETAAEAVDAGEHLMSEDERAEAWAERVAEDATHPDALGNEHRIPEERAIEPDCDYLGGNEDPSKCNSAKCPRHRQSAVPAPPHSKEASTGVKRGT